MVYSPIATDQSVFAVGVIAFGAVQKDKASLFVQHSGWRVGLAHFQTERFAARFFCMIDAGLQKRLSIAVFAAGGIKCRYWPAAPVQT